MKATPLNARSPLHHELELSLAIETAGALIRQHPEALRAELFSRAIGALLRASDAPCIVLVQDAASAERHALAMAEPEGSA